MLQAGHFAGRVHLDDRTRLADHTHLAGRVHLDDRTRLADRTRYNEWL
ncbi:hypothetical protein [Bifidobacterium longum]|nr:hypothetical protein [Bifidobacterium longum]